MPGGFGFDVPDPIRNELARMEGMSQSLADMAESRSAAGMVRRIMSQVQEFERNLDQSQEVALHLVSFGQALTIGVTHVGFIEPSLIYFVGHDGDGGPVRLVQHVTQLSFLLARAPRADPETPRQPIGFAAA